MRTVQIVKNGCTQTKSKKPRVPQHLSIASVHCRGIASPSFVTSFYIAFTSDVSSAVNPSSPSPYPARPNSTTLQRPAYHTICPANSAARANTPRQLVLSPPHLKRLPFSATTLRFVLHLAHRYRQDRRSPMQVRPASPLTARP